MSNREPLYVRVLIVRQGDQWLAQCLERDLAAQAPTEQQAIGSFIRVLKARVHCDFSNGKLPLAGLPPAPKWFFDEWNRLAVQSEQLVAKSVTFPDDEDSVPDAYVISQIARMSGGTDLTR